MGRPTIEELQRRYAGLIPEAHNEHWTEEAREAQRVLIKKWYDEHPEMKEHLRERLSEVWTPEMRQQMSSTLKDHYTRHPGPMTGKKLSDRAKQVLRLKGKIRYAKTQAEADQFQKELDHLPPAQEG